MLANLGEVSLLRGQTEEALVYLREALEVGESLGEKLVISNARTLLGRIDELEGNHRETDQHFDTAIRILEELVMPDRLRECHMEYADLLDKRGEIRSASRHWKSAAKIGKFAALKQGVIQEDAVMENRSEGI